MTPIFRKLGEKKETRKNSYDITLSKTEYKQNCIYDIITDIGNSDYIQIK